MKQDDAFSMGPLSTRSSEAGSTVVGLIRALARVRAYWIDQLGLPRDVKVVAYVAPWLVAYYDSPSLLTDIRTVGVEPIVGYPPC